MVKITAACRVLAGLEKENGPRHLKTLHYNKKTLSFTFQASCRDIHSTQMLISGDFSSCCVVSINEEQQIRCVLTLFLAAAAAATVNFSLYQ